jgi:hypothetical protein
LVVLVAQDLVGEDDRLTQFRAEQLETEVGFLADPIGFLLAQTGIYEHTIVHPTSRLSEILNDQIFGRVSTTRNTRIRLSQQSTR